MKRNKKIFLILTGIILLAGIYYIILKTAPKSASYFPILLMLIGLDLVLWEAIRPLLMKFKKLFRIPAAILYWSPFVILVAVLLLSLLYEKYNPSASFFIYLMGFVFLMYTCKIVPALIVLMTKVIRLVIRIILRMGHSKDSKHVWGDKGLRVVQYLGYGTGLTMLLLLALGMIAWGYDLRVIEHHLSLNDLPEGFRGIRIVQISDLHLGTWPSEKKLEEVVSLVNGLSPDLILFTGDLVNSRTNEAARYGSVLEKVRAKLGIYAVLGNHDYGDYASWDSPEAKQENMAGLFTYFEKIGWNLLNNQHDIIRMNGDSMAVAGVENWSIYGRFERRGDLEKAMEGLSNTPMILLMTHDPSHWDKEVITGYPEIDLTLSGHTHGFQFGIETDCLKWSPVQWLYERWAGMYEYVQADGRKQYLYVNRGLGAVGYPGRVGIKPEITLFVLN